MIYANPNTGDASEDKHPAPSYTLEFETAQAYSVWRDANFPTQYPEVKPEPVSAPQAVTNAQFCAALIDFGIIPDQIDFAIESIEDAKDRAKAKYWWQRAQVIDRSSAYIAMFAPRFGLSDDQINNLFRHAATLST